MNKAEPFLCTSMEEFTPTISVALATLSRAVYEGLAVALLMRLKLDASHTADLSGYIVERFYKKVNQYDRLP